MYIANLVWIGMRKYYNKEKAEPILGRKSLRPCTIDWPQWILEG